MPEVSTERVVPDAGTDPEVDANDAWAIVYRSHLDPSVWVPDCTDDQSCFLFAGGLRAVKRYVQLERAYEAERQGVKLAWVRANPNTWWYLPSAAAQAYLTGAQ